MTEEDDLQRGRAAAIAEHIASMSNTNGDTGDKQDEINRSVDNKLAELFAKHDSVRTIQHLNRRKAEEQTERFEERLFVLERRFYMMRIYGWAIAIAAVIDGLGTTILWIMLTHPPVK